MKLTKEELILGFKQAIAPKKEWLGFCVNLGGDSSPISYHYRVVLLSGHLHLLC